MLVKTRCSNCKSKYVCKYSSDEYEVTVAINNPFIEIICSQYIPKQIVSTSRSMSLKQIIKDWREQHPNGRKVDCEKETGLSRPTVLKWWNEIEECDKGGIQHNT